MATHHTEGLPWSDSHFLGTPEEAEKLYSQIPRGSRAEASRLVAQRGKDEKSRRDWKGLQPA